MKLLKVVPAILLVFFLPISSFAWGLLGHRVVGGIADRYISAVTKNEIRKILGNESIAMASNWADFIKSDRSFDYLGPWHYINLPPSMNRDELFRYLDKDTATDLYTRMQFVVRELKSGKVDKEKKVFYLKLLIHLAGDAHQPMHTARPTDRGGNNIKVYWFNAPTNLHRVWDEHLIEHQQLSYTEHIEAINFPDASELKLWQKQPLRDWIFESYQVAEKLYADIRPEDRLHYAYNYKHVNTMNRQLLKGGIRLAGLLNEIFGKAKK